MGAILKFIYSEKATKFCEISIVDLSFIVPIKFMVEISQNFVVFSEDINFNWQNISISKKFRILATSLSTPLSLRRGWVYAAWFQGYFSDITLEIQTDETEVQSDLYRHLIKGLVFHSWYKGALVRAWLVRFVDEAGKTMMMNGQNSQWPRTTDTRRLNP